uniref:Uncharacterized protein n=1 Tax=Angiostrongylus cantonensis TaxID=6313 RepID=A0A158P898_ANGCA
MTDEILCRLFAEFEGCEKGDVACESYNEHVGPSRSSELAGNPAFPRYMMTGDSEWVQPMSHKVYEDSYQSQEQRVIVQNVARPPKHPLKNVLFDRDPTVAIRQCTELCKANTSFRRCQQHSCTRTTGVVPPSAYAFHGASHRDYGQFIDLSMLMLFRKLKKKQQMTKKFQHGSDEIRQTKGVMDCQSQEQVEGYNPRAKQMRRQLDEQQEELTLERAKSTIPQREIDELTEANHMLTRENNRLQWVAFTGAL